MHKQSIILSKCARVALETPLDASYWFGYYYQSPISADGRWLLAHRAEFDGRPVTAADNVEVGCFDLRDGAWLLLGITRAFNWQQGAMLQWLGPDYKSRVIYNDQEDGHFVARIVDVTSGSRRTVPHAVYAVHPLGRTALGVRYERHYFVRAYHYEGIRDERWNVPIHPEDGITTIDLDTGTDNLLLRTSEIADFDPISKMNGKQHWLEHIIWNSRGTRFGFLHRYGTNEEYATRVFTSDANGTRLFCLPEHTENSYTHMSWRDEKTFVIYFTKQKPMAKIYALMINSQNSLKRMVVHAYRAIKGIVPTDFVDRRRVESGYALVRDREGKESLFSKGLLRMDGHPSWTNDGRYMLTDTYADDAGYRNLLLFNAMTDQLNSVGYFFSPFNSCSYRCDLHPRFSHDERQIIIDTAHSGRRQMLLLILDWQLFM
jgi:hypothetical protein